MRNYAIGIIVLIFHFIPIRQCLRAPSELATNRGQPVGGQRLKGKWVQAVADRLQDGIETKEETCIYTQPCMVTH